MSWLKIHDRILGKCTLSKYNLSTEVLNIGLLISQKSKVTKMCMHLLLYSWKVRREKSHYLQISHKASNSWDDQCEISGILLSAHAPLLSDSWISSSGGSGAGGTPLFWGLSMQLNGDIYDPLLSLIWNLPTFKNGWIHPCLGYIFYGT